MEYVLLFLLMIPPLALAFYRFYRGGGIVPFDLGVVFAGIVFLYAWLPFLGIMLAQEGYGSLQDNRVVDDIPSSEEMVAVGRSYLAFLSSFTLVYAWRINTARALLAPLQCDKLQALIAIALASSLILINFLTGRLLGAGMGESYIDSYAVIQHLPLPAQQILNFLLQASFAANLAAMIFVIAWRPNFHRYVALVVMVTVLNSIISGGSRAHGFLLLFAYVICFSIFVKTIKMRHALVLVLTGLFLFIFAGVLRASQGLEALMSAPLQGGEFFTVFVNSVDLLREYTASGRIDVPWQLYWADLLRLIPQQFLWFEKVDPAVWYVSMFYPEFYYAGGGLAFGLISESVIGLGVTEAFLKGGVLGAIYALIANRCTRGSLTPLKVFVYIWFVVMSYQAIRNTTFAVFGMFIFQVLPLIIFITVSYQVVRLAVRKNLAQTPTSLRSRE